MSQPESRAGRSRLLGALGRLIRAWGSGRSQHERVEVESEPEILRRPDQPAQDWEFVEAQYRAAHFAGLQTFVRMIRARGLDRSLRGAAGMDGLFLDMDRTPTPGEPCLRVSIEGTGLRFSLQQSTAYEETVWWTAVYPIDQAEAALARFLTRMGWFPKGHPLLAGIPLK